MKQNFPEEFRAQIPPYFSKPGSRYGLFDVPYNHRIFRVIATDGFNTGWEHVLVSLPQRCPNWGEMCFIKSLFWYDDETVIQFHPPKSEYVNNHPYCLHLWRNLNQDIILPPSIFVGVRSNSIEAQDAKREVGE